MLFRWIFISILLLHGLIHLMGFAKAFDLAEIPQLTLPISKPAGLFWLGTVFLLLAAAIDCYLRWEWWWVLALVGAVVSQVLVIIYWQDAKFGTILNIIILIGCVLSYGSWNFNGMVKRERQHFIPTAAVENSVVRPEDLEAIPPVVRQWLNRAQIAGKSKIQTAYFKQSGRMKTSPGGSWMPVHAEQYVRTAEPGFLWIADVKAAPFTHLAGRDKYVDGHGHMLIKLMSLIPVADSKGPKIDQGALLRYLAEMVWYPSAALRDYISWEQTGTTTARATMSYGGITASGLFRFNEEGEVKSFEANRYYDRKEGATLEPWLIRIDEQSYRLFEGIRVPTRAEVTWKLAGGDFTWFELEVADLTYCSVNNQRS